MTRKVLRWLGIQGPLLQLLQLSLLLLLNLVIITVSGEGTPTHSGTSFVLSFIENRYLVDEPIPRVFIVAATNETAVVTISVPLLVFVDTVLTIHPGTGMEHSFPYDIHMIDDGYNFKAVYIESDNPIVVEAASLNDHSSDAFLILPTHSLGTDYVVLSYVFAMSSQQRQGPSSVGITALEDATQLKLEFPDVLQLDTSPGGQVSTFLQENKIVITLEKYQTFHFRSKYDHDLTGVRITSNLPVSVVSGSKWTSVGKELMGDHLVENLPPVNTWGTMFYTVPIANRTAGDIIRVLGYSPHTQLRVLSSLDGISKVTKHQLNGLGFVDIENPSNTSLMIMANKRVLVAQLCKSHSADNNRNSDPFMMLIPPRSQHANNYHFMTISTRSGSSYTNYLSIVSKTEERTELILNKMVISGDDLDWGWVQIADSDMSGAILVLQNGTYHLSHKDPNVVFGAQLYGLKFQESYGLPVGQKYRSLTYRDICLSLDQEQEDFFDNDCDGLFDEEILNGIDDDGDGLIDEDVFNEYRSRPQDGSEAVTGLEGVTRADILHSATDGPFEATTDTETPSVIHSTKSVVVQTLNVDTEISTEYIYTSDPTVDFTLTSTTERTSPSTESYLPIASTVKDETMGTTQQGGSPTLADILTTKGVATTVGLSTAATTYKPATTMAFISYSSPEIPATTSFSEAGTSLLRETSTSREISSAPSTESKLTSMPSATSTAARPLTTQASATPSSSTKSTTSLLQIMSSEANTIENNPQITWSTIVVSESRSFSEVRTLLSRTETATETKTAQPESTNRMVTSVTEVLKGTTAVLTTSSADSEDTSGPSSTAKLTLSASPSGSAETIPIGIDPIMVIIPLTIIGGIPLIFICVVIVKSFIAVKRQKNTRQIQPMAPPPPQPPPPKAVVAPEPQALALKSKTYQPAVYDARNN